MSTMDIPSALRDTRTAVGYGPRKIPAPLDQEIAAFVRNVSAADSFVAALNELDHRSARVLTAFAERMASLAIRHQDGRTLRDGLIACALAISRTDDPREVLPVFSLLFRAAEMIGDDPVAEFDRVAGIAGEAGASLRSFARRDPADRSIEAMAYIEGNDADGFRFIRTW
jgi:hypothetical protein